MPELLTTIRVPTSLRERIAAVRAGQQQMTAAEVIAGLLDGADRRARFVAVREAYAHADASYAEESEAWDSLADDGLRSDPRQPGPSNAAQSPGRHRPDRGARAAGDRPAFVVSSAG
jgi:hypothetical protein